MDNLEKINDYLGRLEEVIEYLEEELSCNCDGEIICKNCLIIDLLQDTFYGFKAIGEETVKEHYIPSCYECEHLIESDKNYPCNDCKGLGVSENNHFKPIKVSEKNKDSNKDRHMEICKGLNEIYEKKNKDYGDSFSVTYKEYGATMSAIRLEDKLSRFKRLIKAENEVKDESIRDTLLDLANYSIMTIMEMDK